MQEAHDASVALMIDGEIVAACQEERFTGLKGDYGYPRNAIAYCLKQGGVEASEIDDVALASHAWNPVLTKLKRNANFSVDDWVTEQREFWKPKKFENRDVSYWKVFKDRKGFILDDIYPMDHLLDSYMNASAMKEGAEIRKDTVSRLLGVPRDKIRTITHEDCHTFYSYFASPLRGKVLCLTAEGIGDYSNQTVSEFSYEGRNELSHTSDNHIGHIYQYVTLLLGMKPAQHEYKVMGLAPYANEHETAKSYKVFGNVLKVDGLNIVFDQKPGDLYYHFRDALEGHRFDGIAGAAQKMVEDLLCEWIPNCVKATGLRRLIFSGGVAQNIKACKSIMELDCIDEMYICPAAGDTSLPIGACYVAMWEHLKKTGGSMDGIRPVENIYLGPEFTDTDVAAALEKDKTSARYKVTKGVTARGIAERLANGKVIGRCSGRMEFGLRALGNRSILADPRTSEIVRKVNSAIKFRDFWMPFTPTILAERERDYIVNPKRIASPFMTMAFDSTPLARKELIAGLHPADLTCRAQILEEKRNPGYCAIIREFEKLTGVGGVMNTSFNLHGDAIVLGPKEAIYTMDKSELDAVVIGDYIVER